MSQRDHASLPDPISPAVSPTPATTAAEPPAIAVSTGTRTATATATELTAPSGRPPGAGKHPAPASTPDAPGGDRPSTVRHTAPVPVSQQLSRRAKTGLLITLILGSLSALPAMSMDLYLPALPEVTGDLGTTASSVQLTLTTCMLGLALGQLIIGPMSDQLGRRRPLIIGMLCYVLATAACALAPNIEALTAFRLIQGLTGAAGIVIARAVVRDLFDGLAMARFFSTLMLISGLAPILAPVLGGQLLYFTDWRGLFAVLAVFGLVMVAIVARWLPETLPREQRHSGGVGPALRTMAGLFRDRIFTGYLLSGCFAFAVLFAYVAASPFVVQEIYGGSPQTFSLLFMINSVGMVAVSQINGKILVGRVSLNRVMVIGLVVIVAASAALLLMTTGVFGEVGLVPVAVGFFVLMACMALVLPNANSQALMRTPHAAGAASALLGAAHFFGGAVTSPLVGVAGEDTAVPMAIVQLTLSVLALVTLVVLCRPWRSGKTSPPRRAPN